MKKLIPVAIAAALLAGCDQKADDKTDQSAEANATTQTTKPSTENAAYQATSGEMESATPQTDIEKQSYALGAIFSTRLSQDQAHFDTIDLDDAMLKKGFADGLKGQSIFNEQEMQQHMMAYQQSLQAAMQAMRQKEQAERLKETPKNKAAGAAFLADNAKREGVKVTESGLQYEVIEKGNGETNPVATDQVEVHYRGTFIDGTEFDSSAKTGQTVKFPLNRVIPGWTEGLQLMNTGDKFKFYINSDLAYGDQGRPGIPGGATLIFDVELVSINPDSQPKEVTE